MRVLLGVIVLALGWMVFGQAGKRAGANPLPGESGSTVDWLVDPGGELTLWNILEKPEASWQRWDGHHYLLGKRGEALWVRVVLRNPGAAAQGVLADSELYTDQVRCSYQQRGEWITLRAGESVVPSVRPLWGREAAFPITIPAGGRQTVYLRMEDFFGVRSRLAWWPERVQFLAAQSRDILAEGGYFGVLLALLFYNVALWSRLRFPETGRYLLYLIAVAGFTFISRNELLLLGVPLGSPRVEMISMFLLSLSAIFLVDFARVFLALPANAPRWNRAAQVMKFVMMGLAAWSPAMPWMKDPGGVYLTMIVAALTQVVLMGGAVAVWRSGTRQSRYFVAAFGAFLVGLLPSARMMWWASQIEDTAAAGYAMLGGSALELLFFSVATADRFAQIERENLAAKERLLAEAEHRKARQEAYADELELEVRERTQELKLANDDKDRMIAVLGHDLRSPLTGLTQAAEQLKRDPVGVSLERFVGDAAQTGRQLLLLIEDLVLWSRMRAGTVEMNPYAVSTLIAPVAALHRTLAEQRNVVLVLDIPQGLRVRTDLVLAQTLLRNLMANALKFAEQRVVVSAVTVPRGVRLAVCDDGPGLPAAVAAQLVAETPVPLPSQGGLGLRLCREISDAMKIRMEARPGPGGGTEFTFILPPDSGGIA